VGKKSFDERRMCRVDGETPTHRELWTAFYRLYRISQGHGGHQNIAAVECFHVLMANSAMLRLAEAGEDTLSRVGWPTFIRRKLLETDRRRRLHGRHWEWLDTDKRVARQMCERGQETTPAEVAEVRCKVLRMIREKAAAEGISVPADDLGLMRWMSAGAAGGPAGEG
jgi:hypothetical protein